MNTANRQQHFKLLAKTEMLHRSLSVSQLARDLGLARNSVSIAINHESMLPGVKAKISKHLRIKA